jgi:hypothetical protein
MKIELLMKEDSSPVMLLLLRLQKYDIQCYGREEGFICVTGFYALEG